MKKTLKMFKSDVDWVIAYDVDDARKILGETYDDEVDTEHWQELPPDRVFQMGKHSDEFAGMKMTVSEWIAKCGRGHFASTEY